MSDVGNEALNEKLQALLSSPDSMTRIQSLMSSLGGGDLPFPLPQPEKTPTPTPAPESKSEAATGSATAMPDLSMLSKLMPLLGNLNKENEDTRLLRSLKPYLHGDRERRLDDAIRMMQLAQFMPLLQQGLGKGGDPRE